jgi:uncharacterized damage-inducible protein DinB
MDFDYIALARFHNWANDKLLDVAEQIPHEQLMGTKLESGNTPFETLRHMLDVGWSWRMACIEQPATQVLWEIVPLEDLSALRAYWREEERRLMDYVQSLSKEELEKEVVPSWMKKPYKVKHIIMHIVIHDTEHRSELGWYFTSLGHSPGDMGFLESFESS